MLTLVHKRTTFTYRGKAMIRAYKFSLLLIAGFIFIQTSAWASTNVEKKRQLENIPDNIKKDLNPELKTKIDLAINSCGIRDIRADKCTNALNEAIKSADEVLEVSRIVEEGGNKYVNRYTALKPMTRPRSNDIRNAPATGSNKGVLKRDAWERIQKGPGKKVPVSSMPQKKT